MNIIIGIYQGRFHCDRPIKAVTWICPLYYSNKMNFRLMVIMILIVMNAFQ